MYRVRAGGILLLGTVWIAVVAAAQEAPPPQTPEDPGINSEASNPLLAPDHESTSIPCGAGPGENAPVLGSGLSASAPGADETSTDGTPARFLSQGTGQVRSSNLVALGIVVGLSFGGAAGLASSRLAPRRKRGSSSVLEPARVVVPTPPPVAPPNPGGAQLHAAERPLTHLERLVAAVKADPRDGESRFELALELLRRNEVPLGMRHLSTSFTLYPRGVLRLLEDPTLVKIRELPDVVLALRMLLREQQRRFTGYA